MALTGSVANKVQAQGLTADEFRQIGRQGFGDSANGYSWALAWFHGKLYIGTNHNFLCVIQAGVSSPGLSRPEIPGQCSGPLIEQDVRGRIYAYDPATDRVELVYKSPTVKILTSDGGEIDVAREAGYRTMVVFTERDGSEALYVGTFTSSRLPQPPARLLRSVDGVHFEEVPGTDTDETFRSYRSLTVFQKKLYALGLTTDSSAPVLLEAADPKSGNFRLVSEPNFGDPGNLGAFELAVFNDYLYVGTFAGEGGFQLLKTRARGMAPYVFESVLVRGAYRGIRSQSVLSMTVFKNQLYVGTGIFFGSFVLLDDFKPGASEVLRVRADDSWDIVVGEARDTPEGFKEPISGLPGGFGNPFIGYLWRMVVHDGVLYAGTLDIAVLARYIQGVSFDDIVEVPELDRWFEDHPEVFDLVQEVDVDEIGDIIAALEGGFDLWATTDGVKWVPVTKTGFGDEFSYGVRTFASTPVGLFVGSANPFMGTRLFLGQPTGTDTDGDSFIDTQDNCPTVWNLSQADADGDGIGDDCDNDIDGDCLANDQDPSPRQAGDAGPDSDNDGQPDACDIDDDDDDVLDVQDNCPLVPNFDQADVDGDGLGDACDPVNDAASIAPGSQGPASAQLGDGLELEPTSSNRSGKSSGARGLCGAGMIGGVGLLLLGFVGLRMAGPRRLALVTLIVALGFGNATWGQALDKDDFRQVGEQGLGNPGNSYTWAMEWFADKLLIGTNHNFLCTVRAGPTTGGLDRLALPNQCTEVLGEIDFRGRIYSYDPATDRVELLYLSPMVRALRSDGTDFSLAKDAGYRTMTVFAEPDGTQALYVGTFTSSRVSNPVARILRTTDGVHFQDVRVDTGEGRKYVSFRSMTIYKDRLFVLAKRAGTSAFLLLESTDPASGKFQEVSDLSYGSPDNSGAFNLEVFKGFLYVGTFGPNDGFQVVKTDASGPPPYMFRRVMVDGGYRGIGSQTVLSMKAFGDHLYVGSGTWFGSLAILPDFVPKPAEVLRIKADDSWELVVGEARDTPAGFKEPISGLRAGFGNPFTGYIWRMIEHDGVLYVSTLDTSVFLQYDETLTFEQLLIGEEFNQYVDDHPQARKIIEQIPLAEVMDFISAYEGGFDFWSSTDGVNWKQITHTGFGDEFNYGIRTFASTPVGLFAGSANPFFGLKLYLGQPQGADSDGDGLANDEDNCPMTWNLDQADLDGDGLGDACDADDDGDCILDVDDLSPRSAQAFGADSDGDGVADGCDGDDDGDEIPDVQDNCPLKANLEQFDADSDGLGDACQISDASVGAPGSTARPSVEVAGASGADSTGGRAAARPMCGLGALGGLIIGWAGLILIGFFGCGGCRRRGISRGLW